ncbi:hypothetical protein SLS63_009963 [Diaporthe eres]|uniref:cutinase n=1 Tax=Diaporthe eres TaxID=83184 RepID=A0ABR1NYC1_DIAER
MKFATGLLPALTLSAQALTVPIGLHSRFDVNSILALVSKLFPFDVTLEAAQTLTVAAEEALALAEGFKTTRQDLDDGKCSDLLVIFARGTDEPGNVGALVGPPFFKALEGALGSSHTLAVQGVEYEATVSDYLGGGDPEGSQEISADFRADSSQSVENTDPGKVLVVCHNGDDICQFGDLILLQHLTYAQDAETAADFVVSKAGF